MLTATAQIDSLLNIDPKFDVAVTRNCHSITRPTLGDERAQIIANSQVELKL